MAWNYLRDRIVAGAVRLSCQSVDDSGVPGTSVIRATIPEMPVPIGVLWWRRRDNHTAEILGCWVRQELRRAGVFRSMLGTLAQEASEYAMRGIWTWQGSEDGGLAALRACGFTEADDPDEDPGWRICVLDVLAERTAGQ